MKAIALSALLVIGAFGAVTHAMDAPRALAAHEVDWTAVSRLGEADTLGPIDEDARSSKPASAPPASLAELWSASFAAECDWDGNQDYYDDGFYGEHVDPRPDDDLFPDNDAPEGHCYTDGGDAFDDELDRMLDQCVEDEPRTAHREGRCDDLFEAPVVEEAEQLRLERCTRWLRTSPTAVPIPAAVFEEIREADRREMDRQASKWRHILATRATEAHRQADEVRRRVAAKAALAPLRDGADEPHIEEVAAVDPTGGYDARAPAATKWDPPPSRGRK